MTEDEYLRGATKNDKIIDEAHKRFERVETYEGQSRKLFVDDVKFANADADNRYQWPDNIYNARSIARKPCLTVNITQQHNLQIINDGRQNKPGVNIRPVGNGATFEAAQVFEGIVRHIEYISNAQAAYDTARKFQVEGGIGYFRLATDYAHDDSFDQEIFIRKIPDPLAVYLDDSCQEADKSDAKWGFVFTDMPKDEFRRDYPKYKYLATVAALGNSNGWISDTKVRVAEYFRVVEEKDKLVLMKHPHTGERYQTRLSKIADPLRDAIMDDPSTKSRDIVNSHVERYLIAGNTIIESDIWAGKYIPLIPVIGIETVIQGVLDRKGHTRCMKDPQRIKNYWSSSAVEHVVCQTKTPWLAPVEAIEGYEDTWSQANVENAAVLGYKSLDDKGNPIAAPQRIEPPVMSQAYVQGMQIAEQDIMSVTGQHQALMGEPSNEKSGKAIDSRQRQGENSTYHFVDNEGLAIRYLGKQLIDLIPKIYDTKRVVRILAEDGSEQEVHLDPQAKAAHIEELGKEKEVVRSIFNPNIGTYSVEADIGPAYATKRQEAFNAFSQIATQSPELMNVIGDLLFKNADFPGAEEISERLHNLVPPQALGEGAPAAVTQLQGQLKQTQSMLAKALDQLAQQRIKIKGKDEQKDIDVYEAETSRLKALLDHAIVTPKDKAAMLHDLMTQEHQSSLNQVEAANAADLARAAQGDQSQQGAAP